jgi:O-antigen/teichoic acid export membrane protein
VNGKRTASFGLGSLGTGAVTAVALAVQTGLAAVVGLVLAREFGRGAETDGFFAAYGVFVVVVLAATAIRVAVLPAFAHARVEGRLGGDVAAYGLSVAVVAGPMLVAGLVAADPIAGLLTGGESDVARETAAAALPWMMLAATGALYAGLAASALAALDDYVVAAAGYVLGSVAGLAFILLRVDDDGVQALSWGMALNGAVALAIPALALVRRARAERMPSRALRPSGARFPARMARMGEGVALPLALQAVYVVCLPLAAREGEGAVTSFSYAYLIASAIVAVTASSLGLVTAVPLTRDVLDRGRTALHVVSSSWIALIVIGAAAGVFGLAGDRIVEWLLGASYGNDVGDELGRLVVILAPWAVASAAVSVTFPLVFVAGRSKVLPVVAVLALGASVPLAWVGQELLGLGGLAAALAVVTVAVLVAMLLALGSLEPTVVGLALATALVAVLAAVSFVPLGIVLPAVAAAAAGFVVYVTLIAVVRPPGLRASWQYLRALA